MKRTLATIAAILLLPFTASAAPTTWDYSSGILQPLQSMWSANVKVPYITATSTSASTFVGSVGIGSSTPYAKLSVTNTSSGPSFFVEDSTNDQSPFVIDASGNVGIGTTSPALLVDIRASDNGTGLIGGNTPQISVVNTNTTNNNFASLNFGQLNSSGARATTVRVAGVQTNHTAGAEAGDLVILTATGGSISEEMRVTGAGNVGIGTSSPSGILSVHVANGRFLNMDSSNGRTVLQVNDNSLSPALVLRNTIAGAGNGVSLPFQLGYGGAAGNGGTAVQGGRIAVIADGVWDGTAANQDAYMQFQTTLNGSVQEVMRLTSGALVGIGTSTPGATLGVAGSAYIGGNLTATGTVNFGDAPSIEIPNGTNPTADDPGEIAHDTTDNQLILDDRVIRTAEEIYKFSIGSTSPSFAQGASKRLPFLNDGYTVTNILCDVEGGTSKAITLYGETITCDLDGATDDGSIASPTMAANASTTIAMATTTGAVNYVNVTVKGTWTRE